MKASSLDRRIRKEAVLLVREARTALLVKRGLRGKGGDLETVTSEVEKGLAAPDMSQVRRYLPVLDALVDELVKRPPKSTTRDYIESIGAAVLIALALRAFVIEAFKIPSSSMYPTLEIGDHIFVNKFIYGVRIPWTRTKLFELRGPKRGEVIVFMYPCNPDRDYIKRVVALSGDSVEVRCNIVYVNGEAVSSKLLAADEAYQDYDENDPHPHWYPRPVSRYQETVGDKIYETFHDPERPGRDEQRAKSSVPSGDSKDFPQHGKSPPNCIGQIDAANAQEQTLGTFVTTKSEAQAAACEQQMKYIVPAGHVFVMGDNRANSNDSRYWGSVPIENIKGKALFIWLSYEYFDLIHFWDFGGIRWSRMGNFVK